MNSGRRTEDSPALRASVASAVMIAVAGLLVQDVVNTRVALAALLIVPVASWISHHRRDRSQVGVKFALAAGLLLAFADFLRGVSGASSIDDTRAPLAEIFLWVQALHAFDQPLRRDLQFSLASSAALIALGGSLSLGSEFLVFFVPWGLTVLAAMALSYRSEVREKTTGAPAAGPSPGRGFGLIRPALPAVAITLAVASLVFLFAPRGKGLTLTSLPFELANFVPLPRGSGVVNSGLPNSSAPAGDPAVPSGGAYFGFADYVDLRVRGTLSEDVVMRVRAPQPAFWRGPVFDEYRDSVWRASNPDAESVNGLPVTLGREARVADWVEMAQTYYVEKTQTNVVFAAYEPMEVWFPGGAVGVTDTKALRAGFLLEDGLVYSVISQSPVFGPAALAATTAQVDPEILSRYTQLPKSVPPRVRRLARTLTGPEPTIAGKAAAVERWLKSNTRYLLDLPPQPRGADAVDHFLFEDRRGYCEQIATAMAVLLRAGGVPARFATGYDAGERNVFSGYFEVRGANAHSWVEVYIPGGGWMQFDPTHEVPFAEGGGERAPGAGLAGKLASKIGGLVPVKAIRRLLTSILDSAPLVAATLGILGLAAALGPRVLRRLRSRTVMRRMRRIEAEEPRDIVVESFRLLEEAGKRSGVVRPPSETPAEYARTLSHPPSTADTEDVNTVVRLLEQELYAGNGTSAEAAARARTAARRAADALMKPPG